MTLNEKERDKQVLSKDYSHRIYILYIYIEYINFNEGTLYFKTKGIRM